MIQAAATGSWPDAPLEPTLSEAELHIWRARAPVSADRAAAFAATFTDDERERAERLLMPASHDAFIAARGALREILGRYLESPPAELRFRYGAQGKPALAPPYSESGLEFNLSHSAGYILLAVGRGHEVGIDIEAVREDIALEALARRYFAPREADRLLRLADPSARLSAFFACWTRKEAYLKLKGAGLTFPLHDFEVTFLPAEAPRVVSTRLAGDRGSDFSLLDLAATPACRAAVIHPAPARTLYTWSFH